MPTLSLSFESGETSLEVRRFYVNEAVSTLFEVSVWAVSEKPDLALEALVGKAAALSIEGAAMASGAPNVRLWSGLCARFEQHQAEPTGLSTYHVRIVPALWQLTQRRNHRIFQHLSVPDIIDALLDEWRLERTWKIDRGRYPKLEIRVQYGESDYAFFSRLLEEAGIAFTFPDGGGEQTQLWLGDALHSEACRSAAIPYILNPSRVEEEEYIKRLDIGQEVRPGSWAIADYDLRAPAFKNLASHGSDPRLEQYEYRPGSFVVEAEADGSTPVADDRGAARTLLAAGQARAERSLAAARAGELSLRFAHNALDLAPGVIFTISQHPHPRLGESERLLVTEASFEGAPNHEWQLTATAVFAAQPYRPPLKTPKPAINGVQSATVVGPKGKEIHTDELGRVRVLFPWDRQGPGDDTCSCWLRISQGWAGTGFGLLTLPRVGQEVLVAFIDGNPDEPLVVGRVFNAVQGVPYKLPDHMTRSVWRSCSSPGGGGHNEIMLEDLAGSELLYVRAQKDHQRLVLNDEAVEVRHCRSKHITVDETESVGQNRSEAIGADRLETTGQNRVMITAASQSLAVGADYSVRVAGSAGRFVKGDSSLIVGGVVKTHLKSDAHLHIGGAHNAKVEGTASLTIGGDQHLKVSGLCAVEAGREIHLKAGQSCVIETNDITLKGAGGFIRIDPSGVSIKGTMVFINSGGAAGSGSGAAPTEPEDPEEPEEEEEQEQQEEEEEASGGAAATVDTPDAAGE